MKDLFDATDLPEKSSATSSRRRWYWPPYPLTFIAVGSLLVVAFFANFPAVETSRPDLDGNGKYGPHFELITEYQHGWPMRYAMREASLELDSPINGKYWESASPWKPWDRTAEFSRSAVAANFGAWIAILLVGALLVQLWRSRRRAVWQLRIVDLLGIITMIAIIAAWYTQGRGQRREERRLFYAARGIGHIADDELGAATPAWLSAAWQIRYRREFSRVQYFSGEPGVACQFPDLLVLQSQSAGHEFRELLRRMPQLEALDMFMSDFQQLDDGETFTSMRYLPPMPNLRGINLYDTSVTDADLVWLAKCPRLECIELTGTKIGDDGLQHLARLPKLRVLALSGERITDRGCQTLGQFTTLEDLYLIETAVTDSGVMELARLKNLRQLQISSAASPAALDRLQKELPNCSIN